MHCPQERVIATHIVNALPHLPVAQLPRLNSQLTFLSPSPAALCIVCALCIVSLVHCALSHLEQRAGQQFQCPPSLTSHLPHPGQFVFVQSLHMAKCKIEFFHNLIKLHCFPPSVRSILFHLIHSARASGGSEDYQTKDRISILIQARERLVSTPHKLPRLSVNFPDCPETFQTVRKFSILSRNFSDFPETLKTVQKL